MRQISLNEAELSVVSALVEHALQEDHDSLDGSYLAFLIDSDDPSDTAFEQTRWNLNAVMDRLITAGRQESGSAAALTVLTAALAVAAVALLILLGTFALERAAHFEERCSAAAGQCQTP